MSGNVRKSGRCNHVELRREGWTQYINLGDFSVSVIFEEIILVEITKRVSLEGDKSKGLNSGARAFRDQGDNSLLKVVA